MGIFDKIKDFFDGDDKNHSESTHRSTRTQTVNGVTTITTVEIKKVNGIASYVVNDVAYAHLSDIPEPEQSVVREIEAEM